MGGQGLGFRVWGVGCRVLGFGAEDLGSRVKGWGFRWFKNIWSMHALVVNKDLSGEIAGTGVPRS